jgi:hypothetical protein
VRNARRPHTAQVRNARRPHTTQVRNARRPHTAQVRNARRPHNALPHALSKTSCRSHLTAQVRQHIQNKLPLSELRLDLTWTTARRTLLEDVKKALITTSKRETIASSWQKAGLTHCMSGELYVEASRKQSLRDNVNGTALPNEVDTIMDDEEEFVLCHGSNQDIENAEAVDRGCWQGITCLGVHVHLHTSTLPVVQ